MATVVLIHGTGVRRQGFSALVGRVTAGLTAVRDGLRFVPYYWGDTHGASLAAGGASLPPDTGTDRGTGELFPVSAPDDDVAAWAVLFADPDAELALAAAMAGHASERPPGSVLPEQHIQERLIALTVRSRDVAAESAAEISQAASLLSAHPLLAPAADALEPDDVAVLVARSLVARVVAVTLDRGDPLVPDGRGRDELVDHVAQFLGASPQGSERALRARLLRAAGSVASRAVVRRRYALTQAAHPAAGDVLRYLCRGEPVRADLRALVAELETPVVLIGHSLGGIIALDTLIGAPLPQVRLLVTVGSQGPFLYESGSLPSLIHPEPLPPFFPDWLNVYDRRDLLSYLGADLFPGRVTDVAVDNGQPFPAAHSAYWTNQDVYRLIVEHLP
ncbi:alpha/beta fold hydrolase [Streptomyces hyaluromycini]|uniref:Alpha/beta fold hydrolase n=1 Tax=Streptomyces hyaluromycini TaxID=1377993 RepID=A0ABV1WYA6_9ACTN